jgi:hypothetical protein
MGSTHGALSVSRERESHDGTHGAVTRTALNVRGATHHSRVRQQDPRVPHEVEEYLVDRNAAAGELGGRIGGSIGGGLAGVGGRGGAGGARGGARGGALGARMLKTVVEERVGVCPGTAQEMLARVAAAVPQARELSRDGERTRFAVPLGRTGLQHIVVDLVLRPLGSDPATTEVRLCAYGKEGLLSRKPTAATADKVLAGVTG